MPDPIEQFNIPNLWLQEQGIIPQQVQNFDLNNFLGQRIEHDDGVPENPPKRVLKPKEDTQSIDVWSRKITQLWKIPTPDQPYDPVKFLSENPQLVRSNPYIFTEPKQYVGIEVEIENILRVDPNINLCFWQMKEDGSLRNNGREFVTYATALQYTEPALTQLFMGLNDTVDFSDRTSIHIHLDVRQCTLAQLYSIIFVYSVMENLLFKYASHQRRKNIYCVPITETALIAGLDRSAKVINTPLSYLWTKYTALNLLPVQTQGTLEFRHMPGHNNIAKILVWMDLLIKLKVFAYKHSMETIVDRISELNTNSQYRHFVEDVFGSLVNYLDMTNLLSDMEKAVFLVKHSVLANKFNNYVINNYNSKSSQIFTALYKPLKLTPQQEAIILQMKQLVHHEDMDTNAFILYVQENLVGFRRATPELTKIFESFRFK